MIDDDLTRAMLALCDRFDEIAGPSAAQVTAYARARLSEPIRVAVVGKVKAGKSTLVNAIIGRKVAATADVECTQVVTHYRFGADEGAILHLSGDRRPQRVDLVRGMLPERFDVPLDQISHAEVTLSSEPLRHMTIIDTPGLETTRGELEEASRQRVLGVGGVRQADAIIYLFSGKQLAADVDFLHAFRAVAGDASSSGAIGVLAHADRYGAGAWGQEDPLIEAAGRARELEVERASELAAVLPVAGLLAESAVTGAFREPDARALAALAALSDFQLKAAQLPDGIDDAQYDRLAGLIGVYGLRHARAIAVEGAASVVEWMEEKSGASALRALMRQRYVGWHPQLKAKQAMDQLKRASHLQERRMPLRRLLSEAELDPALHPLEELTAWELLAAHQVDHELLDTADRLLRGRTDAERLGLAPGAPEHEVRAAALAAGDAARRHGMAGDPVVTRAASILARSFAMMVARAGG